MSTFSVVHTYSQARRLPFGIIFNSSKHPPGKYSFEESGIYFFRNLVYKVTNQIPQDNQQERVIPNQVGNPRNKLYRNISKIGYLGIKRMLDKVKVNYSHVSIVQESDLK